MDSCGAISSKRKASTNLASRSKNCRKPVLTSFIIVLILLVALAGQASATPDHFWFEPISSQSINQYFYVSIEAKDQLDQIDTSYNGVLTLIDLTGMQKTVYFTNGLASTWVTITSESKQDRLSLVGVSGESNVFSVLEPQHLDHFWFAYIGTEQIVGTQFEVEITAKDQRGNTFEGYNGNNILKDYYSGLVEFVKFTNGSFSGPITIHSACSADKIYLLDAVGTRINGESNAFNVNNPPNLWWIWPLAAGIFVIALVAGFVTYKKRKIKTVTPVSEPHIEPKPKEAPHPPPPPPKKSPENKPTTFISYVEEDSKVVSEIATGLEKAGYTTWYYERDSIPGLSYLLQTAQAIEKSQAVIVLISNYSLKSNQVTSEIIHAHEFCKPFIPVLNGISHVEFQNRQPEWREAIGSATSISVTEKGVPAILPRIIFGLKALGVGKEDSTKTKV
jgi:hypothetical protein